MCDCVAYLDEGQACLFVDLAGDITVSLVRRDEGGDGNGAAGSEELRDLDALNKLSGCWC